MKQYANVDLTTIDQFATMSDNDLYNRIDNLCSYRNRSVSEGYNPYYIEVELCYARREEQIRNARLNAHAQWVKYNS